MRAFVVISLVGCWSSSEKTAPPIDPAPPPPTCETLLAQFKETQIVIALDGDTDPESRAYLEKVSDAWMPARAECETWTPAFRRCLYVVKTEADNFRCSREQQIEQGVDMGGPDCVKVVEHMVTFLYTDGLRADAEIMARGRARLSAGCLAMPRTMKECALRADGFDGYIECADPKDRARVGNVLNKLL
ncbi:MAG: hypothetical protein ACKV2T_14545 [Kofleriaceae bacterium]